MEQDLSQQGLRHCHQEVADLQAARDHMWLVVSTRMTKCVVCVLCNFVFFKKISPIFISMSLPVFCVFLCFCVFVFYCCVHVVGSTVSVFFVFLCFFLLSSVRFFSSKSVR